MEWLPSSHFISQRSFAHDTPSSTHDRGHARKRLEIDFGKPIRSAVYQYSFNPNCPILGSLALKWLLSVHCRFIKKRPTRRSNPDLVTDGHVRKSCVFRTPGVGGVSGVFLRPGGLAAREVFRTAGVDHCRHRQTKHLRDFPPARALGVEPDRLVAPKGPPGASQGLPIGLGGP